MESPRDAVGGPRRGDRGGEGSGTNLPGEGESDRDNNCDSEHDAGVSSLSSTKRRERGDEFQAIPALLVCAFCHLDVP